MEILIPGMLFFWIAFSIVVGVGARTHGRSGFGWFIMALLFTPLIAGLLVMVLPNRAARKDDALTQLFFDALSPEAKHRVVHARSVRHQHAQVTERHRRLQAQARAIVLLIVILIIYAMVRSAGV